jgi:beta-mannosidase
LNGEQVGEFKGTHVPHHFDLTRFLHLAENVLEIVFDQPPRWLGQFGYTSQMTEWKPRFNYTWDWSPRLVQIGIWDTISLVSVKDGEIESICCLEEYDPLTKSGSLDLKLKATFANTGFVEINLDMEGQSLWSQKYILRELEKGIHIDGLAIKPWWPNLEGEHPTYTLSCRLVDENNTEYDQVKRRIGFKHIAWRPCESAPEGADAWICVVNDRPVFLQGVNFAPLKATFADLNREDYEKRLRQYQELGANLLRINACQFLEREWFYELCDELGLLVWQDFPLTSSGLDNWPPEGEASIEEMAKIARSFIERRSHHVSLLLWSGGNELQGDLDGRKTGVGKPCDRSHPILQRLQEVVQEYDPVHRYIPTSPSGPRSGANLADFGKGLHWDVHGGAAMMSKFEDALDYWAKDDALFRSELYCPGASPVETIRNYALEMDVFPPTHDNPYWTRLTTWWIDWSRLIEAYGREPSDLEEYVAWSQAEQAKRLSFEMKACKDRFPRCGGIMLWSGHDTYPLAINSTLIDYDGNLKPAAFAVSKVWKSK